MKKLIKLIKTVFYFCQGWINYKLFYSRFHFIIPQHIKEQIECRIKSMNPVCYSSGSCQKCGCATTALQMAHKSCEGNCYPHFLPKAIWENLKEDGYLLEVDSTLWKLQYGRFLKLQQQDYYYDKLENEDCLN